MMNGRRPRRRQSWKEQRRRQLQIRILLGVAGVLLVSVVVVVLLGRLGAGGASGAETKTASREASGASGTEADSDSGTVSEDRPDAEDAGTEADSGEETGALTPETIDPTPTPEPGVAQTITISAAGDCTLGTDANFDYSTSLPAKYEEVGDPGYFLARVRDVFAADDLTIVNLEGTLTAGGSRADKTYAFRGDPAYTQILTAGSVEACNLANNHSRDYGSESYEDTIRNVEAAGIQTFGFDRTAMVSVKGIQIGLAGIYELPEGLGCMTQMQEQVKALREAGANLVIVSFHWGTEKEHYPDDIQKNLGRAAIDAGADLVLGHHPHVLQGIEKYNGRYIVYSLGNFCFGGNKNPSDKDTMIFQQTFTVTDGAAALDDQINIIPCRLTSADSYNNYQPMVAEGDEAARILGRIQEYSEGLSE